MLRSESIVYVVSYIILLDQWFCLFRSSYFGTEAWIESTPSTFSVSVSCSLSMFTVLSYRRYTSDFRVAIIVFLFTAGFDSAGSAD